MEPTRLLCPWNFPGKNTGVGCHFLLVGIFLTQGSNPYLLCLLNWQVDFFFNFCTACVCVCMLSHVQLFVGPRTVACQVPLSMEFVDCSLPGSSVYGIFRQEILEWVAISSSRGASGPRDRAWAPCIGRCILHHCAIREALFVHVQTSISVNAIKKQLTKS